MLQKQVLMIHQVAATRPLRAFFWLIFFLSANIFPGVFSFLGECCSLSEDMMSILVILWIFSPSFQILGKRKPFPMGEFLLLAPADIMPPG